MNIKKADGSLEPFSQEKLITSIKRSGIPEALFAKVLSHVQSKLHEGMSTQELYHHITEFLDTSSIPFAKSKYTLKQAIMELGPTGYPFEDYVAKLLEKQKYHTTTRSIMQGTCVGHEIDVIAEKDNQKIMVEAKFHNGNGIKTDVHVALYTKARFDDIAEKHAFTHSMLVTNTKATTDAIAYALCVGMHILAWSYPQGKGLRELVEEYHLFPITSLTTVSMAQKQMFLEKGIVLCSQICEQHDIVDILGLPKEKSQKVLDEVHFLCGNPHLT